MYILFFKINYKLVSENVEPQVYIKKIQVIVLIFNISVSGSTKTTACHPIRVNQYNMAVYVLFAKHAPDRIV